MEFRKFFNAFLVCLGFIVAMQTVSLGNIQQEISLVINGVKVESMESPPVILSGHTMVPARDVFEPVGAVVSWNASTQSVYIAFEEDLIILEIDNDVASFNSSRISMASPARIINDRTMIPVRFVAEALGFDVGWNEAIRTVYIDTPEILEPDYEPESNTNDFMVIDSQGSWNLGQDQSSNNADNSITVIHGDDSEDNISQNQEPQVTQPEMPVINDNNVHTAGQIPSMNFPLTRITDIHVPQVGQAHFFVIEASSEISAANYFMVDDDRLVVDVHNANMAVSNTNIVVDSSPNVSRIRSAQNTVAPAVSRVVFELIDQPEYSIFVSEDRMQIYVIFEENVITDISVTHEEHADIISIVGNNVSALNISEQAGTLVIDLPNSILEDVEQLGSLNGEFIRGLQISQLNQNTVRIIAHLNKPAMRSIAHDGNVTTITLRESTFRNITFNELTNSIVIARDERFPITIENITQTTNYRNQNYIITLPGDFSDFLGYGTMDVNSDLVESVQISTQNGVTRITVNGNRIVAAELSQNPESIFINIMRPAQTNQWIVVLDPGHGGHDPGAVHFGVLEKDVVLNISNMVRDMLLPNPNIQVFTTRDTDVFIPLVERAEIANNLQADLFVSIHMNAVANNNIARGTETYYLASATDANFNVTRREVSEIFQRNLIQGLGTIDRGVRTANFSVLRNTTMPSTLLELGFLTNPQEAAMFADPAIQRRSAEIIYQSIIQIFELCERRSTH